MSQWDVMWNLQEVSKHVNDEQKVFLMKLVSCSD
jgi:hypothetical protein